MIYPKSIATLIEQFQKFPSVGPKSAQRMAFQVLKMPYSEVEKFANAILEAKRSSKTCEICYNISTQSPCEICSSNSRNRSVICVVAETKDLIAIEKTNEYKGLYHVLGGLLRPLEGIGPAQLAIQPLMARIRSSAVTEIIIATNPTVEGDTTALYLNKMITELNLPQPPKVTRLATGIPVGGDLEYIDKRTLSLSFRGRSEF
jgi:recombination protein RecR